MIAYSQYIHQSHTVAVRYVPRVDVIIYCNAAKNYNCSYSI